MLLIDFFKCRRHRTKNPKDVAFLNATHSFNPLTVIVCGAKNPYPRMGEYDWIYGVLLSLGGCTLSNFGVNLQKFSHMRLAALNDPTKTVYTSPHWIIGLSLVIVGSLMDLVSFGFADISLLAPLGAMTLVVCSLVSSAVHTTTTTAVGVLI